MMFQMVDPKEVSLLPTEDQTPNGRRLMLVAWYSTQLAFGIHSHQRHALKIWTIGVHIYLGINLCFKVESVQVIN